MRCASSSRRFVRALGFLPMLAVAGCDGSILPSVATEQAKSARDMWVLFAWTGLAVAALVWALIFYCVLRFRERKDDDGTFPVQFRRNDRMEVVYTVLPMALVVALFAFTYPAERHMETIAPTQDLVVDVSGFRWSWRFSYPALGFVVNGAQKRPPELVLPLGETTRFNVTSVDVDHSFWIPAFLFKRDAIPGLRNVFDLTPTKLGTYRGECGEYCGLDHANMLFTVRVVTPAAFARWAQLQAAKR